MRSVIIKLKSIISRYLLEWHRPIYVKIVSQTPHKVLEGKKIVITGGSKGIGYALAKKFISEGATVIISSRNEEACAKSAEELGCKYLILDLQTPSAFLEFLNNAYEMMGGVDILVNNAGISLHEEGFLEVSSQQYDTQFHTNLKGPFFLTQAFIKKCQQEARDNITKVLFISSETGFTADDRPYGLSKAALNSLVQGLASRYVKEGYRINAIAPGITASEMTGYKRDGDLYLKENPTNRVFLPEEIAEVACFMCSDLSNIINGQVIVCNEGKTINSRW